MSPLRTLALVVMLPCAAWGQYRPPPMSDAERFIADGDELRVAAARASSFGEKDKAHTQLVEAVQAYEKALTADPKAVTAASGLALACGALKDWDRIIKVLAPLQAERPNDIDLAHHLGVALLKKRRYPEAGALLEVSAAANRTDLFIGRYYLGWLAIQRQDGKRAAAEFNAYLAQRPPEMAENDGEIHELLGRAQLLLRDAPRARAAFEAAQKGRAEAVLPQLGLANVLLLEGKQAEGFKLIEGLLLRFPRAPEPRERMARLQLAAHDLKRAEALSRELLSLQDSSNGHLLMGEVLLAQKQFEAAEREIRTAAAQANDAPAVLRALAEALQLQGRHDDAIAALTQAAAAHADQPELLAALGSVYRRAGRFEQAIATHQRLGALPGHALETHLLLGADHFAAAQWDAALSDYTLALNADPDNVSARHWLATTLHRRARARADVNLLDDASKDLTRAVELEPNPLAQRSLGALLLSMGRFADARNLLLKVAALPQAAWEDQLLLGWAQLGADDAASATATFEAALAKSPEPAAHTQLSAGWAVARLSAGDPDAAVKRLTELSSKGFATPNLTLAHLRRAMALLQKGDLPGAQADFDAVARSPRAPALDGLTELLRGLLLVERGATEPARAAFKKAVPTSDKSPAAASTRAFFDAYLEYRRDRPAEARRRLEANRRATKTEAWPDLVRASLRREGELAYLSGALPLAEKDFKDALKDQPQNAWLQHNLACAQYRRGALAQAIASWRALTAVPEATLNLAIVERNQGKDLRQAAADFRRYAATRGAYSALAIEWGRRLEAIYGRDEKTTEPVDNAEEAEATP